MGVFFLTAGNIGKTPGILQDAYELENPKKKTSRINQKTLKPISECLVSFY